LKLFLLYVVDIYYYTDIYLYTLRFCIIIRLLVLCYTTNKHKNIMHKFKAHELFYPPINKISL